jgi:hypothetical protein
MNLLRVGTKRTTSFMHHGAGIIRRRGWHRYAALIYTIDISHMASKVKQIGIL